MVIKINYTSSDVYVSTSVSPVYVVVSYGSGDSGAAIWGQITGTLSNQTDLQNALNAKFDDPTGTTSQYLRGDGSLATFPAIPGGTVTSVDMSVPTGLTISGNPITSAGTLALALASGYSIPTTASQATWNTAYNDSIVSAGVTGTTTKTLTLNQQDGGTVTASWSDIDTGLTSVGLSMPVAFSVANTPLTANGTLAVSAVGTSAQYIRGDGQLATLPTGAGGGSSVNYYLNGSVNQGTIGGSIYYEMNRTPVIGAGTDFTRTNLQGDGLIAQFITDANDPNRLEIPAGAWNFEMYFNVSSAGGSPSFYLELLKYNGTTFTSIANGSTNPETITGGTAVDLYLSSLAVPQTTLLATDRLAIRVYVITSGRDITLHTEDNNLCEIITTFAGGVASLNGLTANTQYFAVGTTGTDFAISSLSDTHTFNLPTASATNRGALSNADWTTFSGKVGGSGTAGQVAYWNGTSSQTGSNNLFWDAANARLGIGTNAPVYKMHVLNSGSVTSAIEATGAGADSVLRLISPSNYWLITNDGVSANLTFNRGGTDVARFSNVGNLLVGSTFDGGQRLQVTGTGYFSGNVGIGISAPLIFRASVYLNGAGIQDTLELNNIHQTNGVIDGVRLKMREFNIESSSTYGSPNNILTFGISTNKQLTLTEAGNVGIGTTSPASKFQIGSVGSTGYSVSNGLAFGNGTQASALDVDSSGLNIYSTNNIIFSPNTTERLRITSGGNLLVGTTTDNGSKFQVSGAATFSSSVTASSFIKSGGTSSQYLMADGSVTTGGGGGSVDEQQVSLICQVFG